MLYLGGTAKLTNFEAYIEWVSASTAKQVEVVYNEYKTWHQKQRHVDEHGVPEKGFVEPPAFKDLGDAILAQFVTNSWACKEEAWADKKEELVRKLRSLVSFAEDFEQPVRVSVWEDGAYALIYIGNPKKGVVVLNPEKYLEYVPAKDYSNVTPAQLRTALNAPRETDNGLVPADTEETTTVCQARSDLDAQNEAIAELQAHMEAAQRNESPELIEMKQELDRLKSELDQKRWALMEELQEKMYEMQEMKFRLEGQIFLLDSQIYSILCYTGQVVKFAQLRKGKPAPKEEPVVVHQKLRFLDEELGRLASLYTLEWDELDMFEQFLSHSSLALDTFAPNERCVTLVRLSRTATQTGHDDRFPYANLLREYEYWHGRTVGIIIRNGENLYLGWTEEDRVDIKDDLIISQTVTEVTPAKEPEFRFESDRRLYIEKQHEERKALVDGIVSRRFVYSILQGVVDNSSILPLPDGVKLNKQSPYVIYATADKWLVDTRFGFFGDILEKANSVVKKGDIILTTNYIHPEVATDWNGRALYSQSYHNARGRGEMNRTHDCSAADCVLYPVNLVEYGDEYVWVKYRWRYSESDAWHTSCTKGESVEAVVSRLGKGSEVLQHEVRRDRKVFVSLKKTGWSRVTGDETNARANFELHDDEFINVSNLSSTVLEWAISTRRLGGWTIDGHPVNYAHGIRYLKKALEAVREREDAEKAVIDQIDDTVCADPEWPLKLVEWKIDNGVRNLTEWQAARFVKRVKGV